MRFPVVDEAAADPALLAARGAVLDAIRRGDAGALEPWLAPDFNGHPQWRADALIAMRTDRAYVQTLGGVLARGGAFDRQRPDRFCAPYWFARRIDPATLPPRLTFEGLPWIVVEPHTPVYASRRGIGTPLGYLDLELVRVLTELPDDLVGPMVAVEFRGRRAYASRVAVKDPSSRQRVCLEKRAAGWLLAEYEP